MLELLIKEWLEGVVPAVGGLVAEPAAAYGEVGTSYELLFADKLTLSRRIKEGMMPQTWTGLLAECVLTDEEWAGILDVSTKSLQRYRQDEKILGARITSNIVKMTEINILGIELFGSKARFKKWLHAPAFALGGAMPIDLLSDAYGKELVIDLLVRLEHGIFV